MKKILGWAIVVLALLVLVNFSLGLYARQEEKNRIANCPSEYVTHSGTFGPGCSAPNTRSPLQQFIYEKYTNPFAGLDTLSLVFGIPAILALLLAWLILGRKRLLQ